MGCQGRACIPECLPHKASLSPPEGTLIRTSLGSPGKRYWGCLLRGSLQKEAHNLPSCGWQHVMPGLTWLACCCSCSMAPCFCCCLEHAVQVAVLAHGAGRKAAHCSPVIMMTMQATQWCRPPHSTHTSGPCVTGWVSACLANVRWSWTIQHAALCRAHMNMTTCHEGSRHTIKLSHQLLVWSLHLPNPRQHLATGRRMTSTAGHELVVPW